MGCKSHFRGPRKFEKNGKQFLDFYSRFTDNKFNNFDTIFIHDKNRKYYCEGIPDYTKNDTETLNLLVSIIKEKKYKKVYLIGTCIGGFQCLLHACGLKFCENIEEINVLTFNCWSKFQNFNKEMKSLTKEMDENSLNLFDKVKNLNKESPPFLKIINLYSSNERDILSKNDFDKISNSNYFSIKTKIFNTNEHNLASYLKKNYVLDGIINDFLYHLFER